MSDFTIVNLQDLETATGLTENDFLAIGQGDKALAKATIQQVGTFLGVSASVVLGDKNTTPTVPSFAFAEVGTYPEWGNVEIIGDLGILIFDGTNFYKSEINFTPTGVVEEGNTQAVSGGEVYNYVKDEISSFDSLVVKRDQAGFITIKGGVNVIPELTPPDYDDDEFWGIGSLRVNGTVQPNNTSYRYMLDYYPIVPGEYETNIWLGGGSSRILLYNNSKEVISTIENPKGDNAGTIVHDVTIPEGCAYIRTSVSYEPVPYSRFFRPKSDILVPTSEVFATPTYVQDAKGEAFNLSKENTKDVVSKLGFAPIPEGTNLLEQLHTSDIEDENVWRRGFLREDGTIQGDATYYYTTQFYRVYPGNYVLRTLLFSGARALVYDQEKNIVLSISNIGSADGYLKEVVLPENAYFIRISNRFETVYKEELELTATEDIYISQPSVTAGEVRSVIKETISLKYPAKRKHPIVTFISDDGHRNELNWYIPILREKGVLSTLAIITSRMLSTSSSNLLKEEVVELYKEGFDIANHTHTHFRLGAGEHTLEEIDEDIAKGRLILNSLGIDCPMFVAPFGSRTPAVDAIIRRYHKADFITGVSDRQLPFANIPPIRSMKLNRVSFDAVENGVSTLTKCKEAVDEAIDFGGWVIFTVHPNYGEYLEASNPLGWEERQQDLRDLIDYVKSLDVPILTAKAAFEFYQNMEELGNRTDGKYYALGMDGSEEGNFFD